jgi:riboflavin transporter
MKETLNRFMNAMSSEVGFVVAVVVFIAVLFVIAAISQRSVETNMNKTQKLTLTGIFSALAAVLMYVEIPLFFAPEFYKLDFSEIPVLIASFMMGPVAGVVTEFLKILIKIIIKPTSTAFVGEFANFVVGCAFVIPTSIIYWRRKTRKNALIGMSIGTVVMTLVGCFTNAFILLPAFAYLYGGMPVEQLIAAGTKVNPAINNMFTFILLAVTPLNILKGVLVSVLVFIIYKPITKGIKNIMRN